MEDRAPYATWPGVDHVVDCTYTLSHGVTPGVATLVVLPQELTTTYGYMGTKGGFKEVGDLLIFDNTEPPVTLRDCRLKAIRSDNDEEWTLEVEDRRWRWRETGTISGCYNQLDPHGKLIPWTIRSPLELTLLCLAAMGEIRAVAGSPQFVIDMPGGLTKKDGIIHLGQNPIWLGVTPTTGTNPPTNWVNRNPAQALQEISEQFGRRVIYTWTNDGVLIARPGVGGNPLPDGSIIRYTPTIEKPLIPKGIAVRGSPTRYQVELLIEAVGEEWNGAYVPINQLSYAPVSVAKPQITKVLIWSVHDGDAFKVYVNGVEFIAVATGVSTPSTVAADLVAQINASQNPAVVGIVTATVSAEIQPDGYSVVGVKITGVTNGVSFTVTVQLSNTPTNDTFYTVLQQIAGSGGTCWDNSVPGVFQDVRATDRLTKEEARQLAIKSVWKTYRIADWSPGYDHLYIPGYGDLVRRQQVVLNNTQVEQRRPTQADSDIINPNTEQPLIINYYNGFSRDKESAVFGTVSNQSLRYGWYRGYEQGVLTPIGSQVFTEFDTDAENQLIRFANYVYIQKVVRQQTNPLQYKRWNCLLTVPIGQDATIVGVAFSATISGGGLGSPVTVSYTAVSGDTAADVTAGLRDAFNANSSVAAVATITSSASSPSQLIVIGKVQGTTFTISCSPTTSGNTTFVATQSTQYRLPNSLAYREPLLFLKTAINVRDAETNELVSFSMQRELKGAIANTPYVVHQHDDVQLNVIGQYDPYPFNKPKGATILEADPIHRANYYLNGMEAQYFTKGALTLGYNGIRAIDVDASTMQVSWSIGRENGAETVASKNTEHTLWLPHYPARRRAEFLAPLEQLVIQRAVRPQRTLTYDANMNGGQGGWTVR